MKFSFSKTDMMVKTLKHIILISLASCSLFFSACHNKHGEEQDKYHKKRPASPVVKSIKKYLSVADSANPKPVDAIQTEEDFNTKGQKVKSIQYTGDSGKIEYITEYSYDNDGNVAQSHTYSPVDQSGSTEKNTYDNDHHVIKTEWTQTDGGYGRHEYKYDEHGKMIQWDSYEKGHFEVTRLYPMIYDNKGRLVESFAKETRNSKDTALQGHETYTYDSATGLESGRLVLFNDVPLEIIESQYDSAHDKIMEIHYERDSVGKLSPDTRIMNVFNAYGEIIQSSTFKKNQQESRTDNTYDEYGHLIESVTHTGNTTQKTRYVYDYYK